MSKEKRKKPIEIIIKGTLRKDKENVYFDISEKSFSQLIKFGLSKD